MITNETDGSETGTFSKRPVVFPESAGSISCREGTGAQRLLHALFVKPRLGPWSPGFLVLALVPQGFFRIFLSMLAVMIAAMIGTRMTAKTLENLRTQAQKVNITRKDMRTAKSHLRKGTTAWEKKQDKIEK